MDEIGFKITGDASGVQKAAKESIKAAKSIGESAEKVQQKLDKVAKANKKAAQIVRDVTGRSSSETKRSIDELSGAMQSSADSAKDVQLEFSSASKVIDDIGDSSDRGSSALKLLGGVMVGTLGGAALALLEIGIDALGEKLVEAFNKGKRAAEEAQSVFQAALGTTLQFAPDDSGIVFDATFGAATEGLKESQERLNAIEASLSSFKGGPIERLFKDVKKDLQAIEDQFKGGSFFKEFKENLLGEGVGNDSVINRKAIIADLERQQSNEQQINDDLRARVNTLEAVRRQRKLLNESLSVAIDPSGIFDTLNIDGGSDVIAPDANAIKVINDAFDDSKVANLKKRIQLQNEVASSLDALNTKELESIASSEAKAISDEITINNQGILDSKVKETTASLAAGQIAFLQFGSAGAGALADVILGFEELKTLGDAVRGIVRNLVSDLASAAAKAALISAFTGGAGGGFRGVFKQLLGGGSFRKIPTAAASTAGTSTVSSLGKSVVSQSQKFEVVGLRVGGGDLLFSVQEAQNTRGVGGVSLG